MHSTNTNGEQDTGPPDRLGAIPFWRSAVFAALCIAVGILCTLDKSVIQSTEAGVVMDLPLTFGGYFGKPIEVTQAEKTILPMDTEFERSIYQEFGGQIQINCQIVLSGGEKRSIHRPEICLPGQGWDVKSATSEEVDIGGGRNLKVTKLILTRPVKLSETDTRTLESVFLYWFIGSDKTTPYHYERILLSSMDRVLHGINHRWAYVVVNANVPGSIQPGTMDQEAVTGELKSFIREIAPYIMKDEVRQSL